MCWLFILGININHFEVIWWGRRLKESNVYLDFRCGEKVVLNAFSNRQFICLPCKVSAITTPLGSGIWCVKWFARGHNPSINWIKTWLAPKSICSSHSTGQPPSQKDPKHIVNEKGESVKTIICKVETPEHSPLEEINHVTTLIHATKLTSHLLIPQNNLIISSH